MEHCSTSAILHLSHRLSTCTYVHIVYTMIGNKVRPSVSFLFKDYASLLFFYSQMTIKELIISEPSLTFLVQLMIVSESSCNSHGHLGASCSNIGRIRTKENIAVGTLLIGATPQPLGAIWSYSNLSLTPLVRFTDRIRISSHLLRNVAEIQNFLTCHQDLSMEKPATRGRRVHLHTLVDR